MQNILVSYLLLTKGIADLRMNYDKEILRIWLWGPFPNLCSLRIA